MGKDKVPRPPIFVIADDDREALDRMVRQVSTDYQFIPVMQAGRVLGSAKTFSPLAVFMADRIAYEYGGPEMLLQRLLDEVGCPVVIMAELFDREVADKWRRMGASDCLPHPTRDRERMDLLRERMQKLILKRNS